MAIPGSIIVLNGAPQGRQFAIAQHLQKLMPIPFNALGLEALQKEFIPQPPQSKTELLSLENSAYILGINAAISGMARRGCNIVADHCLQTRSEYEGLREFLVDLDVIWVAVRDANTRIYENVPYDLQINLGVESDLDIAKKIVAYYNDRPVKTFPNFRWAPNSLTIDNNFKRGALVILYGTTSAGKSTLSRAVQTLAPQVFFRMGVNNTALSIMPRSYLGIFLKEGQSLTEFTPSKKQKEGTYIIPPKTHDNPTAYIRQQVGYYGRQTVSGIFSAISMMCATGINVVTDLIFLYDDWFYEALQEFSGLPTLWVNVNPDLDEINRREKMRPDRIPGFSLGQYQQMFKNIPPDIILADNKLSPEENARLVVRALHEKKLM